MNTERRQETFKKKVLYYCLINWLKNVEMRKRYFLLVWLAVVGCHPEETAIFVLKNETQEDIDSIQFTTTTGVHPKPSSVYGQLGAKQTGVYKLDMTDESTADGSYWLIYRRVPSAQRRVHRFGYYTNGYPHEDSIRFTIRADTTLVDYIGQRSDY